MTSVAKQRIMGDAERKARIELAAALRLAAHFGWDDHVATHMSARLPDGSFLMNPFGLMFEDVYKEMPWHLRQQRDEEGL